MEKVFIEVGGHTGKIALAAARSGLYREVHVFEPAPVDLSECEHNRIGTSISVHRVAVGDVSKRVWFHLGRTQDGGLTQGSSLFGDKTTGNLEDAISVLQINLGRWIAGHIRPEYRIDLWLDCEGAEYLIMPKLIQDGTFKRLSGLTVEWHADRIPSVKQHAGEIEYAVSRLCIPEINLDLTPARAAC